MMENEKEKEKTKWDLKFQKREKYCWGNIWDTGWASSRTDEIHQLTDSRSPNNQSRINKRNPHLNTPRKTSKPCSLWKEVPSKGLNQWKAGMGSKWWEGARAVLESSAEGGEQWMRPLWEHHRGNSKRMHRNTEAVNLKWDPFNASPDHMQLLRWLKGSEKSHLIRVTVLLK